MRFLRGTGEEGPLKGHEVLVASVSAGFAAHADVLLWAEGPEDARGKAHWLMELRFRAGNHKAASIAPVVVGMATEVEAIALVQRMAAAEMANAAAACAQMAAKAAMEV